MKMPRESVAVLNKTPVCTPLTKDLVRLRETHQQLLVETQHYMARLTYRLHKRFLMCNPDIMVWISGFAGCWDNRQRRWLFRNRTGGVLSSAILPEFFEEIVLLYADAPVLLRDQLHVVRHFSRHHIFQDVRNISRKSMSGVIDSEMPPDELLAELCSTEYKRLLMQAKVPK